MIAFLSLLFPPGARPAFALEVRLSAGAIARQEVVILAGEWRPEPQPTFGPRVGVEAGLGERWRAGLQGQWTRGDFRVDPSGPDRSLAVDSWAVQLTGARVFVLGNGVEAHLGPVLEHGGSDSEMDAGATTVTGPESTHWSAGVRIGLDVSLFAMLKIGVEFSRLVGGAEATRTDPPVGTSWNADSTDLGLVLTWTLGL